MTKTDGFLTLVRLLGVSALVWGLAGCSPRHLIIQSVATELARQGGAAEDDLGLAREASSFYLKLSEGLLREAPNNLALAEAVSAGFTQYAFAFVAFEAERLASQDAKAAQLLNERARRLYLRAHRHAMAALEQQQPGFLKALSQSDASRWPTLKPSQVGVAYWAAASWGAYISLSKDLPDVVADLPVAFRLAQLAWRVSPKHANGDLSSLMGSFEAARAGGSAQQASHYFDAAIAAGAGKSAGPYVAKAESIALTAGDRQAFEALLRQALRVSAEHRDLPNEVMRERAQWLLATADDLF
ncbi:MAG: hypothetical protein EBT05_08610 [Betaproteobacteria bacterium]|nr:hypothetical protein [Betaproteobacteria bacterium]